MLSEFNIKIAYRSGPQNVKADALTRMSGSVPTDPADERIKQQHQVLLPPDRLELDGVEIDAMDDPIFHRIADANKDDELCSEIRTAIAEGRDKYKGITLSKCAVHDGRLPSEQTQQLDVPITSPSSPIPTPVFQLPGTIETICVKALPDTGSSQNVIDKNLVQSLFPSIPVLAVDESTVNLLVAPDSQPISCIGKIFLSWMFKDESEEFLAFLLIRRQRP